MVPRKCINLISVLVPIQHEFMTISHTHDNSPTVADDNSIRFPSCTFSTEAYGLINRANDLVTIWKKLVNSGFPLDEISSLLKIADEPIEIIRTIDALECCDSIYGIERIGADLKKNLSSIITQKNTTTEEKKQKVLLALTTTTDELRIAYTIVKMGYPLEFRDREGPDFRIGNKETKLLEAKSRFNRKYVGGISDKSVRLNEKGIMSLLCRDAFPLLEEAFGEQNTHIALINLSHSEYGLLLAMHSLLNDRKFELKKAMDDALILSREEKDAVVLYVESSGGTTEYFGITLERKIIEDIGRSLDKIESILRKSGKSFDYYDVAYIAQNANDWIQGVKESSTTV
jgi:hypothetical protein